MKKQRLLIDIWLVFVTLSVIVACNSDNEDDDDAISVELVENSQENIYSDRNGSLYFKITSSSPLEVAVINADKKVSTVKIPEYVIIDNSKYRCTSIGHEAFRACLVRNVTIPNTIKTIGPSAFAGCWQLTNISIPNSVTSIGSSAFSGCTGLESISIPNSVTIIAATTFQFCFSLESISIPESLTSLGYRSFYKCSNLKTIIIPNAVTTLGDEVFQECI